MSDTMGKVYDAFISYRHSELDTFVAEQLHKELEAFRVPGRIVKEKKLKKQKIERVFRDKDELPLASNLTDPLITALKNSEFLIVVCTPRLPESQWCRKEIETFIQFHGRERVLLVLAEGEPEESFPDIMCQRERTIADAFGKSHTFMEPIDPLGADVRGKNKKEVKKKLKQELLRLTAVMFGCDYDDLKERHREQALKKRLRISGGISAALLVFGCVSCYQAGEIKKQYIENKKSQSEIMAGLAREKLDSGYRMESIKYALSSLPENLKNPEYPINYQAVSTLTEALRVYDNGIVLKADDFLEHDADIDHVMDLGNGQIITIDVYGTLTIWDLEKKEVVASYDTAGFFLGYQGKFCLMEEETLLYHDDESLNAVKIKEQEKLWSVPLETTGQIIKDKDKILFSTGSKICEIEKNTGEIVREKALTKEEGFLDSVSFAIISKDGTAYYVAIKKDNGESVLLSVDSNSLDVTSQVSYPVDNISSMAVNETGDTLVLAMEKFLEDEGNTEIEYKMVALNSKTLELKWEYVAENKIETMYQMSDGKWFVQTSYSVEKLNGDNGQVTESESFDERILNAYLLADERVMLLMKDGSVLFQNVEDFTFLNLIFSYKVLDDWLEEFHYIGGHFITLNFSEKQLLLYNKKQADGMEVTTYVKEELQENVEGMAEFEASEAVCEGANLKAVCNMDEQKLEFVHGDTGEIYGTYEGKVKFIKQMCFSEDGTFLMVQYQDDYVEILDTSDFTVKQRFESMEELQAYGVLNDAYFVLRGINYGYVVDKSSLEVVAVVDGYVDYEEDDNVFLVYNAQEEICRVPFYSVEELVEMAGEESIK